MMARAGFPETARHLANEVVDGGVDVVALQEIDVGTDRAMAANGIDDYNEYILAQVSAEEAGLQGEVTFHRYSLDDSGRQVPYQPERYATTVIEGTDAEGRTSLATITREHYDENGNAVSADSQDAIITVYSADVQSGSGSKDYTLVYGSSISHDGGTYGNGVLLGPDARLQRDANGNAIVQRHDLGANDPGKDENRTALAVGIVSGGEQATVISTHFSAGDEAGDARATQYDTLGGIAEDYGDNTIVLGDFNSGEEDLGALDGDNDPGFWSWGAPIDRIYTSDDVASSDRDHVEGGESDHSMITWEIDLDA